MKQLKKKGNEWLVVDLHANTVDRFKSKIAAQNFIDGIAEVQHADVFRFSEGKEMKVKIAETTMTKGRFHGPKT